MRPSLFSSCTARPALAGYSRDMAKKGTAGRKSRPEKVRASRDSATTVAKPLNRSLHAAKATKQDEFYAQRSDIGKEIKHYTKHFKGKTVLCNCDAIEPTRAGGREVELDAVGGGIIQHLGFEVKAGVVEDETCRTSPLR